SHHPETNGKTEKVLEQYLHCFGYGTEAFTWEDTTFVHAPDLVDAFHTQFLSWPHPDRQTWGKGPAVRDSVVFSWQQVQTAEESNDSDEGPGPLGSGLLPSENVGASSFLSELISW
uniref:Uncharacterized protein n=1 Tax=Laticauda laticaudata TaxID=8630 RepID=A0A8C5SI49_LATLA